MSPSIHGGGLAAWRLRRDEIIGFDLILSERPDGSFVLTTNRQAERAGYIVGSPEAGFSIDTTAESGVNIRLVDGHPNIRT